MNWWIMSKRHLDKTLMLNFKCDNESFHIKSATNLGKDIYNFLNLNPACFTNAVK